MFFKLRSACLSWVRYRLYGPTGSIPYLATAVLFSISVLNRKLTSWKITRFNQNQQQISGKKLWYLFCYNWIFSLYRCKKLSFLCLILKNLLFHFRYSNLPRRILRSRKLLHVENNGDCCWQFNSAPKFRGNLEYAKIGFSGLPKRSPKSIRRVLCDIVRTQLNRTWRNWKFV